MYHVPQAVWRERIQGESETHPAPEFAIPGQQMADAFRF